MYVLTHNILINGTPIPYITSVEIKMSVEQLSNTATVELPATAFRKRFPYISDIKKGDEITIAIGYDNNNMTEFTGYIQKKTDDVSVVKLDCEDSMALFKETTMTNGEHPNISLKNLVKLVVDAVNNNYTDTNYETITPKVELDYKYDKFVFENCTAYEVLKKIQDECKCRIYLDAMYTLHVVAQYMESEIDHEDRIWSFQRNICKEGTNLQWRSKADTKLFVEVHGKGKVSSQSKNGKKEITKTIEVVATAGELGGDKFTQKVHGITDKATLQAIADNAYAMRNYTGFEGSFNSWLVPYAEIGDHAIIRDEDDTTRNGTYYIKAIDVSFSSAGGVRKITLGNKISK